MRPTRPPDPVRLIVSGGPGSGKTALINALAAAGETCCAEVSRDLIREQRISSGRALPWVDLEAFARECSRRMLAQLATCVVARRVFLDRGLPDLMGYLRCAGRDVPESLLASATHYTPVVFWAPPWREIYVNDAERPQSYAEAAALGEHIRDAYEELGFDVVDLPRASVDARVAHVRTYLGGRESGSR
jgi:predicted ATPase